MSVTTMVSAHCRYLSHEKFMRNPVETVGPLEGITVPLDAKLYCSVTIDVRVHIGGGNRVLL